MRPSTFCYAVQLFALLLLSNTAIAMAEKVPYHHCFYDEIHKKNATDQPVQISSPDGEDDSNDDNDETSTTFDFLRVRFSVNNFDSRKKHCKDINSSVKDVHGVEVQCQQKDVLDTQKKRDLLKIVRSAVNMHTARLKVKKMKGPIKVPELKGPLCKRFSVPECHKTTGVSDADFVLYVSSRPSSKTNMFAAGAPCAAILNGRPVVGVLMYTTEHIQFTAYSVRVAAHEIAHALGFTHTIMKNKIGKHIKRADMRYKHSVEKIHTENVVKFVQKQYQCERNLSFEIEDEKGELSVPSHSHWKRRNALEELMAPIVTTGYYTYLTLALFHDLGFYRADFDKAEEMEWGKAGGCNFFEYRCVGDGVDNSRYFCSERGSSTYHCAPGRREMGTCSEIYRNDQLPYAYRYFWQYNWGRASYQYYAGGESLMTDRCPIYEAEDDLSCTNPKSKAPGSKGESSWCLRSRTGALKNGHADRCANVKIIDNDLYIDARSKNYFEMCRHNGHVYTVMAVIDDQVMEFECPSKTEVEEGTKKKKLLEDTNKGKNTDDFNYKFDDEDDEDEEDD